MNCCEPKFSLISFLWGALKLALILALLSIILPYTFFGEIFREIVKLFQ